MITVLAGWQEYILQMQKVVCNLHTHRCSSYRPKPPFLSWYHKVTSIAPIDLLFSFSPL